MRVLNLVPSEQSRFFDQQVRTLESLGVDCTTLSVPGHREYDDGDTSGRSVVDYARLYPNVLSASFDDYDLIHANYGLTAPHAICQPNLPVVLSLWGTDLYGKYGPVSRFCARFADAVVVMSPAMAEDLGREAHVLPHGVDLSLFKPAPTGPARQRVGWDAEGHHVLFPYPPERGVKNYPRAQRIVDAASQRVSDPIELHTVTGVPHDGMPSYLNAADALLLTSTHEGSPNAVKEALACNVPVVSTDVGDVATRLAGLDHSWVCASDAELVDGLIDALTTDDRPRGRAAVREISVQRTGERLLDIYRDVVDG
ncbi:glycosyltransferase [Halolamina litorea]|uniref:Glycosyltransferase n=1 Tax=Halolamina litorea TaxID=1515593 RepID=A0ABD6BUW5_9EURY